MIFSFISPSDLVLRLNGVYLKWNLPVSRKGKRWPWLQIVLRFFSFFHFRRERVAATHLSTVLFKHDFKTGVMSCILH